MLNPQVDRCYPSSKTSSHASCQKTLACQVGRSTEVHWAASRGVLFRISHYSLLQCTQRYIYKARLHRYNEAMSITKHAFCKLHLKLSSFGGLGTSMLHRRLAHLSANELAVITVPTPGPSTTKSMLFWLSISRLGVLTICASISTNANHGKYPCWRPFDL